MNTASTETTALDSAVAAFQILFYLSPLLIAVVTLFLAWWRFKVFRVREPAITTDLQVSSRRSSPSYNALNAIVVLTNTSRVAVEITRVEWTVRILSPYYDDDVEDRMSAPNRYPTFDGSLDFPWDVYIPPQEDVTFYDVMISLDPGESNVIGTSVVIPDWIEAVEVLVELDSPSGQGDVRLCWIARCPHDIKQEA